MVASSHSPSLSPSAVATALDIGRDTVDHWISEGWLQPADPRHCCEQIDLAEALRFIRAYHLTIHRPDALGLAVATAAARSAQAEAARLRDLLGEPDAEAFTRHLLGRYAEADDMADYLDRVAGEALRPWRAALARGGDRVAARRLGVAAARVRRVAEMVQPTNPAAPDAVALALEDDQDPTPAALAALVLAERGRRLGPDGHTGGVAAVLRAVADLAPDTVCLTLSRPARPHAVAGEEFAALCRRLGELGLDVVTMTPAWLRQPLPGHRVATLRELGALLGGS